MRRITASAWARVPFALGCLILLAPRLALARGAGGEEGGKSLELRVTEALDAVDLTPPPAFEVPDPPPHEGAMIDMPPHVIEPPDLIRVEVLDALEGRPITGERLVRPDGTITLGFYGEVHVRGLTARQARIKVIKQLRKTLLDETLGLTTAPAPPAEGTPEAEEYKLRTSPRPAGVAPEEPAPAGVHSQAAPAPPPSRRIRAVAEAPADRPTRLQSSRCPAPGYFERAASGPAAVRWEDVEWANGVEPALQVAQEVAKPAEIKARGSVTIRIEIGDGDKPEKAAPAKEETPPSGDPTPELDVDPYLGETHVLLEVTAFNSKNYFVLGQVNVPGKLPITGNDTVLEAIQYAGGLLPAADLDRIVLVRPGRNGKPPRRYKVDLGAIQARGETETNYQIFPGDRLCVHAGPASDETPDPGSD